VKDMSTTKEDHERRNNLTAPEHYKRYNVEVIDAYLALHPLSISKLSIVLFNIIMDTKLHYQPSHRFFSKNEDKRIFNNKYITLENVLNRCHPIKYNVNDKAIGNDLSNLMGRLQELDDNNIFYIWKCGKPFNYMFVMERDIGVWKYFNTLAYVPPKTIKKILALSTSMINSMVRFEKAKGRDTALMDVELSFVNEFLPLMISKTNPSIHNKFKKYTHGEIASEYLIKLKNDINLIDDYEGLEQDDSFIKRLPIHLQEKIEIKQEIIKDGENKDGENMTILELNNDLIPKNENLIRVKNKKVIQKKVVSCMPVHPHKTTFTAIDPFSNCNDFIRYYKEVIRSYNGNAKFYKPDSERIFATKIMDLLIQNGKNENIDFLRSWIRYYIQSDLQGNNVYKEDKTSLSNFAKTFKDYQGKYFRG